MADIAEELKALRNATPADPPSLAALEAIAAAAQMPLPDPEPRNTAAKERMLPACYTAFPAPNINIKALHEETLFYIFYMLHSSDLQIKAYNELLAKGYAYSTKLGCFLLLPERREGTRTVTMFDPRQWEKVSVDVAFDEAFLASLTGVVERESL